MNADEIREQLQRRVDSGILGMEIVTADEVTDWPEGTLDSLVENGVLAESQPAETVTCDACFADHVEPVQYVEEPPGSPLRAYIACPEAGRVAVDTERMRRWEIQADAADLAPSKSSEGDDESQQPEFVHSSDYTSITLRGESFLLAPRQAAVVAMLQQAYRAGVPDLHWRQIQARLKTSDYEPARMHDVFKSVTGWRSLIASERRGFYRLNL